jgi:hypothetical protein
MAMSMISDAAEAKFREAVWNECKRTGRPFSEIWIEMGGPDGAAQREVARLTQAVSKVAGELLDGRARARARLEGIDYRQAFAEEARRDPETARCYGVADPDRPAQVPWYRQPPPEWRKRSA